MNIGDTILYFDAGCKFDPPKWAEIVLIHDRDADGFLHIDLDCEIEGEIYRIEDVIILEGAHALPPGTMFYAQEIP